MSRFWLRVLAFGIAWALIPWPPLHQLLAQSGTFHRFTIEDGLPSSHVLCVERDAAGHIWAGTESGVVCYDGFGFRVYNQSHGLPQNEAFNIIDDGEGRIWLRSFNFLTSLELNSNTPPTNYPFQSIFLIGLSEDTLLVHARHQEEKKVFKFWDGNSPSQSVHDLPENPRRIFSYQGKTWEMYQDRIQIAGQPAKVYRLPPYCFKKEFIAEHPDGGLIFPSDQGVLCFDGQQINYLQPKNLQGKVLKDILAGIVDKEGGIWLSSSGGGVYRYRKQDLTEGRIPKENYLQEEEVNWMEADKEGNIWFSTTRGGLIMKPVTSFHISYPNGEFGGRSIEDISIGPHGELYLAHENNRVTALKGDTLLWIREVNPGCRLCRIRSLTSIWQGNLIACTDEGLFLGDPQGNFVPLISAATKFARFQAPFLWVGQHNSLFSLDSAQVLSPQEPVIPHESGFKDRVYASLVEPGEKSDWLGNHQGLWLRKKGETWQRFSDPRLRVSILDIQRDTKGRLWVATDGSGVFMIEGEQVTSITENDGLSSNNCRRICPDDRGGLWIASKKGVNYLQGPDWKAGGKIRSVGLREGLPSNEIQALRQQGDSLWIGTPRGLACIPIDYFDHLQLPPLSVQLTRLQIAGRDTLIQASYQLPHWQNELNLTFTSLSLLAQGDLQFRYRVEGLGKGNWQLTQNRELNFRSLAPGQYKIELQVRRRDARWSPSTGISLSISPPFSQTAWFWILCLTGAVLLTTLAATLRLRQIRKRDKRRAALQQQITELKLQALRSQMNPHFIFNSLTAIQNFITLNNDRAAHKYLSTFSRLIRKVLENSRVSYISLADEIETLQLYLDLEHLRFKDRFTFEIRISPDLDPHNIFIPPMLVQPFMENAIRHGLKHRAEKGHLQVDFAPGEDAVICIIEDNGIGRAASQKLKSPRPEPTPSRGLGITEARLQSLNELIRQKAVLKIEDLAAPSGKALGTRVTIHLPTQQKQPSYAEIHYR